LRGADPDNFDPDLDYGVDPARGDAFFEDARRFLPWLERGDLTPDMSGLRPKLDTGQLVDFVVAREEGDLEGLINLVGIESPGLTSAPALAEHVGDLITEAGAP
jgi:L-2-hydroxyglutarate oxidase LhgO